MRNNTPRPPHRSNRLRLADPAAVRWLPALLLLLWAGGGLSATALGGGRLPPGDAERALAAFYDGHYTRAAEEYTRLWSRQPEQPALARDLAAALLALERPGQAVRVLQQAGLTGRELGEAKLADNDPAGARRQLYDALKTETDQARIRLLLGMLDFYEGRFAEALTHFWVAQETYPRQGSLRLYLARCFAELAKNDSPERIYFERRAQEEYTLAYKYDASLWQVHRDLANLSERQENWSQAIRHWKRVDAVIGSSHELEAALARLRPQVPTPTPRPTAVATVVPKLPPPLKFDPPKIAAVPWQSGEPVMRVGLNNGMQRLAFGCTGPWRALDSRGRQFWEGRALKGYRLEKDRAGRWLLKSWKGKRLKRFRKSLTLEPLNARDALAVVNLYQTSGYNWSVGNRKTRYYRGQLQAKVQRGKLRLINHVPLNAYLLAVVPGEMPALWPPAALQTQAVVARTDSLLRRGTHRKKGYDVCSNAHCAMYQGILVEHPRTHLAVTQTARQVLRRKGKLLPTFYSHSCGGMTQGHQEAWWDKAPDPFQPGGVYDAETNTPTGSEYRTGFPSVTLNGRRLPPRPGAISPWLADWPQVFCNDPEHAALRNFRWFKIITARELSAVLESRYGLGQVRRIKILSRSPSAYVRRILVEGDAGKTVVKGDRIRSALGGLRSNLFTLQPVKFSAGREPQPEAWLLWGGGWGHGVGLCQVGAGSMGRKGYSYTEILRHYFPEGEVEPWK